MDTLVSFRTVCMLRGRIVTKWRGIAHASLLSWWVLDISVVCPMTLVPQQHAAFFSAVYALKLLRLLRLGPLMTKLPKGYQLPVKLLLMVFLVAHVLSCVWRAVRRTMTTVEHGDIVPQGTLLRIFTILTMLISSLFFGIIVTMLTHFTQRLFIDDVEQRVVETLRFLKRRKVSLELRRRVEQNLRHQIWEAYHIPNRDSLSPLSPAVKRDLYLEPINSTVLDFPLFLNLDRKQCLAEDLVVEEGQCRCTRWSVSSMGVWSCVREPARKESSRLGSFAIWTLANLLERRQKSAVVHGSGRQLLVQLQPHSCIDSVCPDGIRVGSPAGERLPSLDQEIFTSAGTTHGDSEEGP